MAVCLVGDYEEITGEPAEELWPKNPLHLRFPALFSD
jgi:hypothetical protein